MNKLYDCIRIISSQNTQYMLLPDRMREVARKTCPAEQAGNKPYDSYTVYDNKSLSKAVVRRILKAGPGPGNTAKWRYRLWANDSKLSIGCQAFDYTAIQALRRWTGAV